MEQPIHYCHSWFRMKKKPVDLIDEATALARHKSGNQYTALIGPLSAPHCFVEMLTSKGMIGVGFLDEKHREYLTYQFHTKNNNTLFLSMATHREFERDLDIVSKGTSYIFHETGELIIRREIFNPHDLEESKTHFDVKKNYESAPEFGKYSNLIRIDR